MVLRLFILLFLGILPLTVSAQVDPGAREDAEIERRKILRAADQIDQVVEQSGKMQAELDKLRAQVQSLSDENKSLKQQLADFRAQSAKERDALIDKVAEMLQKQPSAPAPAPKETAAAPKTESGYEYVVAKGDNLWSITQSYQKEGLKVTVDDIRKANGLKEGEALKAGQKLFIPKK
jgi:LysM repeat protein